MKEGATVQAHDPVAIPSARQVNISVAYSADPYEATQNADCLLLLTGWPEYRSLDWARVGESVTSRRMVDARNFLDRELMRSLGFEYQGIGWI